MRVWTYLLASLALGATAVAEEDLGRYLINKETNGTWFVLPEKPKAKYIKAEVAGGGAFRIRADKGRNPWDVQASSPIAGAIHAGDVILLNYFARAEQPAEGGSALTARIQLAGPPYSSILEMTSKISGEWKNYCAFRVVTAGIDEKKGNVSIHLATAKQVIDLGPVFVFNFGPDYDKTKLAGTCDG
jgi:hypothetical protein